MKFIIELSPGELKNAIEGGAIDSLIDVGEAVTEESAPVRKTQKQQKKNTKRTQKPDPEPEEEDQEPDEEPAEETGGDEEYSLEDVRAVLVKVQKKDGKAAVGKLIKKFGAAKLTDVDPSDYADLIEAAEA